MDEKLVSKDMLRFCKEMTQFHFIAEIRELTDYHMTIDVYQITAQDEDFNDYIEDGERYMSAYIKWDGCSSITFDDPLHLCGKHSWEKEIKDSSFS